MSEDHAFPCYGAIPFRALRDKRLAGVPLAVLGIIAAHDRFGRNGQGCTASQGRLAELVGCRREAINAAITLLDHLGYITCGLDEKTGRRRSYSVSYDNAADNAAFRTGPERADRHRPKRSKACAPQRTSSAQACALEHTSNPTGCAVERTTETPAEPHETAEIAGEIHSSPIKEYIPLKRREKENSGFSMQHEAGPEPPDLAIEDDPTAIPDRSQQNANERLWARHGRPSLGLRRRA